jgi:CubicO group peptidase (beta-lactamase class C family)
MPSAYPLADSNPAALALAAKPLFDLERLIAEHIAEGRYPGCQYAVARHGKLALFRSLGRARTEPESVEVSDDTLFLMFSNTKVLTMAAVWSLVEEGKLSFMDPVAWHLPDFAQGGKEKITLHQVATHQAGFPSANVSRESWEDHGRMRDEVCAFALEWEPGSRLHYHPRAAHLTMAMVMEAVTGQDFRTVIRERVIAPLGLEDDLFVGVPESEQHRCADSHSATGDEGHRDNSAAHRAAGLPHGGGYGTARGMAAFYQMMLGQGRLGDVRLFSPRLIATVTRDATGDRPDGYMEGIPMRRGLGPHMRGTGERVRGLGTIASPRTFGHGGVGSSYCWADPESGVSFAYLTNCVVPEPWHTLRMDRVSNLVHAAID